MEIKLKKKNGFVRLRITDEKGQFVSYIHVANFGKHTTIFIPDDAVKSFQVINIK